MIKRLVDSEIVRHKVYLSAEKKADYNGLTVMTDYAKLVSKAGVDFILVGDSVGTTMLGFDTTIPLQ